MNQEFYSSGSEEEYSTCSHCLGYTEETTVVFDRYQRLLNLCGQCVEAHARLCQVCYLPLTKNCFLLNKKICKFCIEDAVMDDQMEKELAIDEDQEDCECYQS